MKFSERYNFKLENFFEYKILWRLQISLIILINLFLNIIKNINVKNGTVVVKIMPNKLLAFIKILKNVSSIRLMQLIDITCVEILGKHIKFNVIYFLLSLIYQTRINVLTQITNLTKIVSSTSLYWNADWLEREIWDLFGLFFLGNTNLRRILTDYGFLQHPFKKNFPLTGHYEVNFSFTSKLIECKRVTLVQELRNTLSQNILSITRMPFHEKTNYIMYYMTRTLMPLLNDWHDRGWYNYSWWCGRKYSNCFQLWLKYLIVNMSNNFLTFLFQIEYKYGKLIIKLYSLSILNKQLFLNNQKCYDEC